MDSKWETLSEVKFNNIGSILYGCIRHSCRLYNLIFWGIGVFFSDLYEKHKYFLRVNSIIRSAFLLIVFWVINIIFYFYSCLHFENILFYGQNIILIYLIIYICASQLLPRCRYIEFLGRYSLPIYLYHVLYKQIAATLFDIGTSWYYCVCLICFIAGSYLIFIVRKVKLIDEIVFGSIHLIVRNK